MVPFDQSAKNLKQKRYHLRNMRKFWNKKGTNLGICENSATKMVPLEKKYQKSQNKNGTISENDRN